ncbi:MAG: ABC transporter substrate-binding protein, partial [Acidimicrobiales bacterium]
YPYNQVGVRKALSLALDRNTITSVGESGFYLPDTNATGLALPAWQSELDPAYKSAPLPYNPSQAKSMLEGLGFKPGANGFLNEPNGQPFDVVIDAPSPYTDWMTDTQLMVTELKAAGIHATVNGESLNAWTNDYTTGNFDITFCGQFTTDNAYGNFVPLLQSSLTAPTGKAATGDYERYTNTAVDAALAKYATTNNPSAQQSALNTIEQVMVNEVPVIPLFEATAFGVYSSRHAVGWPSASNPYEAPGPGSPWGEVVILRLKPVS